MAISRCPRAWCGASLLLGIVMSLTAAEEQTGTTSRSELRWWKGNLHTHSFWSDGDHFPEMIVAWYKSQGYHFLAISDHNVLPQSQRWLAMGTNQVRQAALKQYQARFDDWVEHRNSGGVEEVRLKPLAEYRPLFEEPGRFLLIPSEEISDEFKKVPVHLNASNVREYIPPQGGQSIREVMQNNVDAVLYQRRNTGQRMVPHLNHPNFHWGVTAEDLARVRGERFFEVYNGHPLVNDPGDTNHPGTDRLWDIALSLRIVSADPEPLYGLAVDDAHNYHQDGPTFSNGGRGWIMVRARHLTPESILKALEEGDFYASSGVLLREIQSTPESLFLEVEPSPGVTYRTVFIGTRRGFDARSEAVTDASGAVLPITRRYSSQIGEVLSEVEGTQASYRLRGDELYVRACIISSKSKINGTRPAEKEAAWTQPVIPALR